VGEWDEYNFEQLESDTGIIASRVIMYNAYENAIYYISDIVDVSGSE